MIGIIGAMEQETKTLLENMQEIEKKTIQHLEYVSGKIGNVKQSVYEMTAKYQQIGAQIDKIAVKLDREKNGLLNDNIMLEQLYKKK